MRGEVHIMQESKMSHRDHPARAATISIAMVLVQVSKISFGYKDGRYNFDDI